MKDPKKNMALSYLNIHCTLRNIQSEYNNNELKTFAPTWNDSFDLPDGSCYISDILDYCEFIIKKHETLTENPSAQIYLKQIKYKIVLKYKQHIN